MFGIPTEFLIGMLLGMLIGLFFGNQRFRNTIVGLVARSMNRKVKQEAKTETHKIESEQARQQDDKEIHIHIHND